MVFMSQDTERTISLVKASTDSIINSFRDKTVSLKKSSAYIKKIIRESFSEEAACDIFSKLFKSSSVEFVAIDGTLAKDRQLDMVIFYAGSFAYHGTLDFRKGCTAQNISELAEGTGISSAIPIYEEDESNVSGMPKESGIEINAERLPSALMHLSEYYLALKTVTANPVKVVLLDRTLAGDVGHLIWSVKERLDSGGSVFLGLDTPYGKVTKFDLCLARLLHPNAMLGVPAPRSHLLKYALVGALMSQVRPVTAYELAQSLGIGGEGSDRVSRELRELHQDYDPFMSTQGYKLKPGIENYWERVFYAVTLLAEHIFNTPEGEHPLIYDSNGERRWINSDDVEFMVLIIIYKLLRLAWDQSLLVIGLIKDSSANELVKTVMPILRNSEKIKMEGNLPSFNSDKSLLQTYSVIEAANVHAPWKTFEFDACFRTMVPQEDLTLDEGESRVKGAYKNVISAERMFLKAYVQLWQSEGDPSIRSHVFSYDRPCYPGYDQGDELLLRHMDGKVEERVLPVIHYERESPVAHLVMAILCSMSSEAIPEALGHNYPLFLADKKAKAILEGMRNAYLSTVSLEVTKSEFNQQVLFNQKFRDYRAEIETTRKRGYR
jgi:hypothetical protein